MAVSNDIAKFEFQSSGANKVQSAIAGISKEIGSLQRTNERLRVQQAKLQGQGKKNTAEYRNLTAAIKANNATITKNKSSVKELEAQLKVTDLSTNQLRKRMNRLKRELNATVQAHEPKKWNRLNKELGDTKTQMDRVNASSSRVRSSLFKLKNLIPALGVASLITGIVAGFRKIIKNSSNLEKSLSSLSAITGLSGDGLKFMEDQAKETSKQTLQSANDIVKAYQLVGSVRPELLKNKEALAEVTKQAIILSEATGGELALEDSAKALGATLNQFNLTSADSVRVINALSAGSKAGAAEVKPLTEAFKNFGPVAADSNISLEQSIGLLETLAEKQLLGAEAGTKLRGVVLRLQQAGFGFASGQFNINDALEDTQNRLNLIQDPAERSQELIKLFGAENITAGNILLSNIDKYKDYTEAVTGTNTALEQQAIQNDNLAANWRKLVNRINNALSSSEASGFLNTIVKGILNLGTQITIFRNKFVDVFNDLIKSSGAFRAVWTTITQALVLNFTGIKKSIEIAIIDPIKTVAKVAIAAFKGDIREIPGIIKEGFNEAKQDTIDLGQAFVNSGKKIRDAYKGDNLDQFLLKTKEVKSEVDELNKSLSGSGNNQPSGGGGGGGDSQANKKAEQNREKLLNRLKELQKDYELSQLESDEKQLQSIRDKYAKEIEAAKGNKDIILQLEELQEDELAAIREEQRIIKEEKELQQQEEFEARKLAARKELDLLSNEELKQIELDNLKSMFDNGLISREEYLESVNQIEQDYQNKRFEKFRQEAQERIAIFQSLAGTLGNVFKSQQEAEVAELEANTQKKLKIAGDDADKREKIEEEHQEREKEILKKYADKDFAIKVAQIITSTATAAMNAYAAMAAIPGVGPVLGAAAAAAAIVAGGAQIKRAKTERDRVKSLEVGGYTGGKNTKKVAGVVHEDEYVIASPELNNPFIGNFVSDVIEPKRQRRLNYSGINNAINYNHGYQDGGPTSQELVPQNQVTGTNIQPEEQQQQQQQNKQVLMELLGAVKTLNRILPNIGILWEDEDTFQLRSRISDQENIEADVSRN